MNQSETWIHYEAKLLEPLLVRKGTPSPESLRGLISDNPMESAMTLYRSRDGVPKGHPKRR